MFAMSMAMGAGQGLMSHFEEVEQAKSDRKWQKYNNALVQLQDDENQRNIRTNKNRAIKEASFADFDAQVRSLKAKGSINASAGASGTAGGSVDSALFGVRRNLARVTHRIDIDLKSKMEGFNAQSRASQLNTQIATDVNTYEADSLFTNIMEGVSGATGKFAANKLSNQSNVPVSDGTRVSEGSGLDILQSLGFG